MVLLILLTLLQVHINSASIIEKSNSKMAFKILSWKSMIEKQHLMSKCSEDPHSTAQCIKLLVEYNIEVTFQKKSVIKIRTGYREWHFKRLHDNMNNATAKYQEQQFSTELIVYSDENSSLRFVKVDDMFFVAKHFNSVDETCNVVIENVEIQDQFLFPKYTTENCFGQIPQNLRFFHI